VVLGVCSKLDFEHLNTHATVSASLWPAAAHCRLA